MQPSQSPDFNSSQQRVHDSMVALLARAGLEYRGRFVDAAGARMHYLEYGPASGLNVPSGGQNGRPAPAVLLLHGGGAGSAIWYRQIAALSRHFRVIAPDNVMFGLSEQCEIADPVHATTPGHVLAFMDAIGLEKAMVAGLSVGGAVALAIAARHPERVEKLAVLDAACLGRHLPWVFKLMSIPLMDRVLTKPRRRSYDNFFKAWESSKPAQADFAVYGDYGFAVIRCEGHSLALRRTVPRYADLGGQRYIIPDEDLGAIKSPTLIIWGEEDHFFPVSHGHRAWRQIPGSLLKVIPGAGHNTPWDAPDEVNEALIGFFSA